MSALLSQVFSLLAAPSGNLVYQVVLVFSIAGALQSTYLHWHSHEITAARRTALGLAILLAIQVLLFAFSTLGWQGVIHPAASLPPLDRAATFASLVWVIWLWAFPKFSRAADRGAVLLSLLTVVAAALGVLSWAPRSGAIPYNHTIDDLLWQFASLGLIIFGALLVVIRRLNGYANGLAFLALAFLGHIAHVFFREAGDYSGIIRLAYIAAYPVLLTLPQRLSSAGSLFGSAPSKQQQPAAQPQKRYSAEPKTIHHLLALAVESTPPRLSQAITRAISQTMLADLCFLLYLTDEKNELEIASGYDLIREENLEGGRLDMAKIPRVTNALQRGRPLRLPASGSSADIKGLSETLGLNTPGDVLSVPIVTPEKQSLGGVLLLSPYSNRVWNAEDQAFLVNMVGSLTPIIQRSRKVTPLEQEAGQFRAAPDQAEEKNAELESRSGGRSRELAGTTAESNDNSSQRAEIAKLRAAQEDAVRTIQELRSELADARSTDRGSASQVELELKAALGDAARLQNQLQESNRKVLESEQAGGTGRRKGEQAEVIASLSQELRQPMSSISGYTDLLLGESVGILGALQRKFLERIKASTERMGSLMNDMIQLNTLEAGLGGLNPEPMDLNLIIDNALAYTSTQIREKNISMHLDLPKKVAPVSADREALQQVLIHLLQNAGAAAPAEGTVRLKVQTAHDNDQEFVMIQVTDNGGGIPQEDLPRVFSRLYRADNVLIQGVGDTGVGLSIAKTLTEAQHGRIWVESEPGVGATFSVLLPAVREPADSRPAKETK